MAVLRMIVLYLKLAHGIILGQFVIAPHIRFGHWNIKKCHFIIKKCHRIIRLHKNCSWMLAWTDWSKKDVEVFLNL